jgi:hypothetical protein
VGIGLAATLPISQGILPEGSCTYPSLCRKAYTLVLKRAPFALINTHHW